MSEATHTIEPTTAIEKAIAKSASAQFAIQGAATLPGPDGRGYLIATDGRMLAVADCAMQKVAGASDPIIPAALFAGRPQKITVNGECRAHYPKGVEKAAQPIEGTFPPYVDILPSVDKDYIWTALDAGLLLRLANAINARGENSDTVILGIQREGFGAGKPLLVMPTVENVGPSFGVLMPVALPGAFRKGRETEEAQEHCAAMYVERVKKLVAAFRANAAKAGAALTPATAAA